MIKFVIAPDSFKGTMSSQEICNIIETCILALEPDAMVTKVPVADGGEGLVDAYLSRLGGTRYELEVTGPLFQSVTACWAMLADEKTAIIEMAAAAGLPLVESAQRNPELTTTVGVGELIMDALAKGAQKIILGLGGSATNDGGIGLAHALGYRFLDLSGNELLPIGANLVKIARIVPPAAKSILTDVMVEAACDVNNVLFGMSGAACIFSPQKGADPAMVQRLDAGLRNLAVRISADLGADVETVAGGGAAGGLGAGVIAFLGGTLRPGIELLLDTINFNQIIQEADFVITGEGHMDGQSLSGKTPVGIARRARQYNIPVIGIAGSLGNDLDPLYAEGFSALFSTIRDLNTLEATLARSREDLAETAKAVVRLIQASRQ